MFKENPVLATFSQKKTTVIVFRYVGGSFCVVFFCIPMFSLHEGPWISLVEGGLKEPMVPP